MIKLILEDLMKKGYQLSDDVWMRVVNIVQEAMLLGVDVVDLLRQVRVDVVEGTEQLELTPEYVASVTEMHTKWLERAEKLRLEQQEGETVVEDKQLKLNFN